MKQKKIQEEELRHTFLHTNMLIHTRNALASHTNVLLHKDCHRHFYAQTLSHTDAFAHKHFYTHTQRNFLTQTFLHKEALAHRGFLHTECFKPQKLFDTNVLTQRISQSKETFDLTQQFFLYISFF